MIIDSHGHYTTAPKPLENFRAAQLSASSDSALPAVSSLKISDVSLRESIEKNQLRIQKERGTDMTIFSPRASHMAHHVGSEKANRDWAVVCNDIIKRICDMFPQNFVGVCQLPQVPGVSPKNCIAELERSVKELGFIGCNLNPDPSGGMWTDPPLTDKYW